jgi:hypothetical protein
MAKKLNDLMEEKSFFMVCWKKSVLLRTRILEFTEKTKVVRYAIRALSILSAIFILLPTYYVFAWNVK